MDIFYKKKHTRGLFVAVEYLIRKYLGIFLLERHDEWL
jgi:hypothetical protein